MTGLILSRHQSTLINSACGVKYNTARAPGLGESKKAGTSVFINQDCGIEEGADGPAEGSIQRQ